MRISVGKRLAIGFAIMIVLILAPAAAVWWWTGQVQASQRQVLEVSQPTVAAAAGIRDGLHQSQAGLRGYMAVGSEPFAEQHREGWLRAKQNLKTLESLAESWPDEDRQRLTRLKAELGDIATVHGSVKDACGQDDKLPMVNKLVDETSPLGERMLAAINGVIRIESKLEKTPQRQKLMQQLTDLRDSLHAGLVEMHSYLTTARDEHAENFRREWQADEAVLPALAAKGRLFTPEQAGQFGEFRRLRSQFAPMPEQLFAIRDSKAFNLANDRLANQAAPREAAAAALLAQMITRQQAAAANAQGTLQAQSALLAGISLGGPGVATIVGMFVGWSVTRRVSRPLKQMMRTLESVAAGQEAPPLPTSGKDEFSRMATAINSLAEAMQNQNRQVEMPENALDHQRLREFIQADSRARRPFSRPAAEPVASEAEAASDELTHAEFRQELAAQTQQLADSSDQLRGQATQLTELMGRIQAKMPQTSDVSFEGETIEESSTESHTAQTRMKGPKAPAPSRERLQETV